MPVSTRALTCVLAVLIAGCAHAHRAAPAPSHLSTPRVARLESVAAHEQTPSNAEPAPEPATPVPIDESVVVPADAHVEVVAPVANNAKRGSLSKEQIRRVINRNVNNLRICGERAWDRNPDAILNLRLRFVISASGEVQEAVVLESQTNDREADGCVLEAFRTLRFPPPEGGGIVVVSYPVRFCGTGR
jgi:TonB family protein